MKRWALALALVAAGCGGEKTQETPAPALPPAPPAIPEVGDLDDGGFLDEDDPGADSLAEADTVASGAPEPAPAAPSFAPFLSEFKVALQNGTARRHAALGDDLSPEALAFVADDPAFRQKILAAGADRYRRYGTRRETYVVVGYDREGNVVPEDEAETESGAGLVFDIVDGEYRLVRIDLAG